jgi:hypothetical protein
MSSLSDSSPLGKVKPGLTTPRHIAEFIQEFRVTKLTVAGNPESGGNWPP